MTASDALYNMRLDIIKDRECATMNAQAELTLGHYGMAEWWGRRKTALDAQLKDVEEKIEEEEAA
jgi:hypothetical protein